MTACSMLATRTRVVSMLLSAIVGASAGRPWEAAAAVHNWTIALAASSKAQSQSDVAPSAPTGVNAVCGPALTGKVVISWNAVSHATSYDVLQATAVGGPYSLLTNVGTTSYTVTEPALLQTYYWKIRAYVGTNWVSSQSAASPGRTITLALVCS